MVYLKSNSIHSLVVLYYILLLLPMSVTSKAIMGVDLGSLYMKVALVQRNSPLEIVTNMHSKRKTENMILFDSGSRFYGADASSMAARKPLLTPESMSIFLGRNHDHPTVQVCIYICLHGLFYKWNGNSHVDSHLLIVFISSRVLSFYHFFKFVFFCLGIQ